jgi:hypothetical protein
LSVGCHHFLAGEMNGCRVKAKDRIVVDNLLSFEEFLKVIAVFVYEVR